MDSTGADIIFAAQGETYKITRQWYAYPDTHHWRVLLTFNPTLRTIVGFNYNANSQIWLLSFVL